MELLRLLLPPSISVNSTTNIKAAAFKAGMLDSSVASATYVIAGTNIVLNGTFDTNTGFWSTWSGDGAAIKQINKILSGYTP